MPHDQRKAEKTAGKRFGRQYAKTFDVDPDRTACMQEWIAMGRTSTEGDAFRAFFDASFFAACRQRKQNARRNGKICRVSVRLGNDAIGPCGDDLSCNTDRCWQHRRRS
jgi:hypothetical protein